MIGYAVCGSFCTHSKSLDALRELIKNGEEIVPILSPSVLDTDTRFGLAKDFITTIEQICGKEAIKTIGTAEPLGPTIPLEALIIAPCTGNTMAKIASGITDTSVTMAAKATLRADRPVLISLASNDALSSNLTNIAALLQKKHVYFVPMRQDDVVKKPHSLVAEFSLITSALEALRNGKQLRPLFL